MSITKTPQGILVEPDINFTDNLFEFPVLISISKKKDASKNKLRELGLVNDEEEDDEDIDRVVGMVSFPHESIIGYGEWYTPGREAQDIEQFGFDLTEIYIKGDAQTYWCIWNRKMFKEKINEHVKKLSKLRSDSVYEQIFHINQLKTEPEKEIK
jgi:hypothetical protein